MSTLSLEKRIAAAFADDVKSVDLAALIDETDKAIIVADASAKAAREKSLDLIASPNVSLARTATEDAALRCDQLRRVLKRLEARLNEIEAAEYAASWEPEFQEVQAKRDELAAELREVYPELTHRLADLFHRIEAADKEVSRINGSAPPGDHRHLLGVELTGRGLASFSTASPSIAKELKLPDFERSDQTAWPPHRSLDPALFAPVVEGDPRLYTDRWHEVWEERAQAAREKEAREAKEKEAAALENYHGPRWWEKERA